MYLEPLVLVGRGLVLGELTFKNRGQFGSRFFLDWFFVVLFECGASALGKLAKMIKFE